MIMRIELTDEAKAALERSSDAARMTQVAYLSRLIEWFAHQPPVVRAGVLGQLPPEESAAVRRTIIRTMIGAKG
jgi:hypothetical protein